MTETDWDNFLVSFDDAVVDKTSENLKLFRIGDDGAIFAAIEGSSSPMRISLRCDRLLAKTLRQRYETVLAASQFDPITWNTIILTGQLSDEEVKDLARLSYNLSATL